MSYAQWVTFGLAVLSTLILLGWQTLQQKRPDSWLGQRLSVPRIRSVTVFIYGVGLPYLALIFGLLTPRSLGLRGLDHLALIDLGSGNLAGQLQRAVTLMLLEWLLDANIAILAGTLALLLLVAIRLSLTRHQVEVTLVRERVLQTVYFGIHWAFYRAIFWALTGDLYLGVVLGAAYVMLEWGLMTLTSKTWTTQEQRLLVGSMVLFLTSAVFYYSPNLWFLLLIHIAMMAIVNKSWGVKLGPEVAHGAG